MSGEFVNYSEVYRLEPGALIPVPEWPPVILESTANGFDVRAVLNTIGSAVETELEWKWPAPYDGEQRRAAVRIRRKTRALEGIIQEMRVSIDHQIFGVSFEKDGKRVSPAAVHMPPKANVLADFPGYVARMAEMDDFTLHPWQQQMVDAMASGTPVRVVASPGRQAATRWVYERLQEYLESIDPPHAVTVLRAKRP